MINKGLGKAISAIVLSTVGSWMLSGQAYLSLIGINSGYEVVLLGILGLIFVIVSLVYSCQSINKYKYLKREYGVKPVATLVLGIIGLISSIGGLVYVICSFLSGLLMAAM